MLHLITGGPGVGKTEACVADIRRATEAGRRSYLIVPEQATVTLEHLFAYRLPPSAPLLFEVTNFTRFADTVLRALGGIGVRYASAAAKQLLMWRTLGEVRPLLKLPGADGSKGEVRRMLAALSELSSARCDVPALNAAANALGEGGLAERLRDLSLIKTVFRTLLEERFADGETALDEATERLHGSALFAGTEIFIDSFTSFTEQQYALIAELLRTSDVTVTLPLPEDADASLCYEEIKRTRGRLLALSNKLGISCHEHTLRGNKRTLSPSLVFLTESLWKNDITALRYSCEEGEASRAVRLITAETPYSAALFVASDISRRVREEGCAYRDFTVLSANADTYRGILDTALERAEIPVFTSRRADLLSLEAIKLVMGAYAVIVSGFRRSDLITYLKCGFTGLPLAAIDAFELYTERWDLSGARLLSREPFRMNPSGYTDRTTPYGEQVLSYVEEVRRGALPPLQTLRDASGKQTVPKHVRALADFLLSLDLPDQLEHRAALAAASGDGERKELLLRLWDVICDTLDMLAEVLPDTIVTAEEFASLFAMAAEEVDIGRIPASEDEVTFGTAELMRAEARHVYLFGVNEGEFPEGSVGGGFFTEPERARLASVGLVLGEETGVRSSRTLFTFLRALSSASVSVTLVTMQRGASLDGCRPSSAFLRASSLMGAYAPVLSVEQMPALSLLYTKGSALSRLGELVGNPIYPSLASVLSSDPAAASHVAAVSRPVSNAALSMSPALAHTVFPARINSTQSRLEKYIKCPFSYFCEHVLKLGSGARAAFDNNEIGSYVHAMLEEFFRDGNFAPRSEQELEEMTSRIEAGYLEKVGQGDDSPRLARLWRSLHRTSKLLITHICEEFSASDFRPRAYELRIGDREDPASPSAFAVELEDGGLLSIYGTVDRADTLVLDGNLYVRVIDYKTGTKKFKTADIENGLNLQMLLYLFAIWKSSDPAFLSAFGVPEGGRILPAGILYMSAATEGISLTSPKSEEETIALVKARFSKNGLLLDDERVLEAMEHGLTGLYIPISRKKTGELTAASRKSLADYGQMGEYLTRVSELLRRVCAEMKRGGIPARDSYCGEKNCKFCEMRPVCRIPLARYEEDEEAEEILD